MAQTIMQSVGPVVWVDCEQDIDTVTGISGSGPAYYFKLMEIMIDTAMAQGVSAEAAKTLVLNTALGAAKLAVSSDHPPSELRRTGYIPGWNHRSGLIVHGAKWNRCHHRPKASKPQLKDPMSLQKPLEKARRIKCPIFRMRSVLPLKQSLVCISLQ